MRVKVSLTKTRAGVSATKDGSTSERRSGSSQTGAGNAATAGGCRLLPERQVLEREIATGPERRAQGAEQSEYEGHCPLWLARRSPIVQSRNRVLADDSRETHC